MKLSFSTKGWHNRTFDDFCEIAKDLRFSGIELHNVSNTLFTDKDSAFQDYATAATLRKLYEQKITIPCISSICDISDEKTVESATAEVRECIRIAKNLHIPYIRVRANKHDDGDTARVEKFLSNILPECEEIGVTLLIETSGLYCDTAKLRDMLQLFACDSIAALWDTYSPYFIENEAPERTIENLGAYIKHIHVKDAVRDGENRFCLMGEGELPIKEMILALRSVNYDGFVSLEWNPDWCKEIDDMEIILSQFENFMSQFEDTSKSGNSLYYNKRHTGKYVWKKDLLIDCTFSQVLDRMVEEFPDHLAFKYTTLDYTRTYYEFRKDVDTFARSLISLGVKAGHHVAVWATNVPQWYIAFWATTKIGAVLVTMNTAYKISEAEYLLKQSDTHTIIMVDGFRDSNYSKIIAELCPELENTEKGKPLHAKRLPFLRNVITVGFKQKGCITWEEAIDRASSVPVEEVYRMAAAVDKDDVCNMQYTSGTTGFPKGVMLTHYNVVNNGKCIGDRMDLSTADRMMIQVPMFHCFGMVLAMTASMTHGATLLPLPYYAPKPALACINSERITAFHGVPTMFIALLEHEDFPKTDFSYMRTGIMAGSPCPISVMQDVIEKMHMDEITIVYGQTEASPGCTMSSTDDSIEVRVGTVGRALPEIECKIVDPETGEDCPDEVTGEFVARGYNIMKGYYKMPKATAAAIDKDGWLHTGDLACRTPEGNYRITGRLKDMIIRGGENIYPKEIEEFIYTHPKVKDVQVIGVPDEQYGEEIMACIILKDGEEMTEAEMKAYINDHMARHKVPRYIDFVTEFPMNVAGKILKYKMRENAIEKLGLQKASSIVTA
ncbi:MAG: AMP-binding protein [Clostridia bacterium]|nr:AMP-binding protein [Clostridia bacterium]MBQ5597165.1 AMP-binding protein [Clostridia bacterium]